MTVQTFSFDGHDLSSLLFVRDVTRSVHPPRSIGEARVPGMDGALMSSVGLEPMDVTVKCAILGSDAEDVAEARRRLALALSSPRPARLVLPDDPSTYLMAVFDGGGELKRLARMPGVDLTFRCPDPVAYGERRRQSVSGTAVIRAGGTYPARPIVTVRPPAGGYWRITNRSTGEYVRVPADFTGGQTVVLDFGLQRCTINGTDARVDIGSDFFALSGDTELSVSGGTAVVEWDERWL